MQQMLSIGQLAREAEVKVPTIRYYEQIGLVESADRSSGNQRRYDGAAVRRLRFIRHARDLGFSVPSIRQLIDLSQHPDQPCGDADEIARNHLIEVETRIERLQRLKQELTRMLDHHCEGSIASCQVIEAVADHNFCIDEH